MRHYVDYDRGRYIALGYNKADNTVLLLNPLALAPDDQQWVGDIVEDNYAQTRMYLKDALARETHPSGADGWTWAVRKSGGLRIPAYDLKFSDSEQQNNWRGGSDAPQVKRDRMGREDIVRESRDARDARLADAALVTATQNAAVAQRAVETATIAVTAAPHPAAHTAPSDAAIVAPILEVVSSLAKVVEKLSKTLDLDARMKKMERAAAALKPASKPKAD